MRERERMGCVCVGGERERGGKPSASRNGNINFYLHNCTSVGVQESLESEIQLLLSDVRMPT